MTHRIVMFTTGFPTIQWLLLSDGCTMPLLKMLLIRLKTISQKPKNGVNELVREVLEKDIEVRLADARLVPMFSMREREQNIFPQIC